MRLAVALVLLAASGCTYDLLEDAQRAPTFEIDEVLGTYAGERTLRVGGQAVSAEPTTATVARITRTGDSGTVEIAVATGDRTDVFAGDYGPYGIQIFRFAPNEEVQLIVDAEGFLTGSIRAGGDVRELTGRLTAEHFDLFERAADGSFQDDVRTSRR